MKLIDADKLIEEMSKWYWDKEKQKAAEEDASPMDLFTHLAITTVQEQPTAFDVDKISKELVKQKKIANKKMNESDDTYSMSYYDGFSSGLAIAIGITKGGGVE